LKVISIGEYSDKVLFLILFTQNCANFCNFPPNLHKFWHFFQKFVQILTIFTQNFANFYNFYQKKGGKLFQRIFACGEKIKFCGRIFTYGNCSRSWLREAFKKKKDQILWHRVNFICHLPTLPNYDIIFYDILVIFEAPTHLQVIMTFNKN